MIKVEESERQNQSWRLQRGAVFLGEARCEKVVLLSSQEPNPLKRPTGTIKRKTNEFQMLLLVDANASSSGSRE